MQLTEHFSLSELTRTNSGIINIPASREIENLKALAENVLEPLRQAFGSAITVNSGYRSKAVNAAVKGALNSQHVAGQAADLNCENNAKIFHIIKKELDFDQLIWEGGNDESPSWVHVSFSTVKNRKQVLKMRNGNYSKF